MHCRVGSGLTDRQQDQVRERLQPLLEPNTKTNVPKCYKVTGRPQEKPDFWVKDPYKSLVLKASGAHFGYSEPSTRQYPARADEAASALVPK